MNKLERPQACSPIDRRRLLLEDDGVLHHVNDRQSGGLVVEHPGPRTKRTLGGQTKVFGIPLMCKSALAKALLTSSGGNLSFMSANLRIEHKKSEHKLEGKYTR